MSRRVELIGAALSSVAALLWLVYVVHIIQALTGAIGATGQPFFHLNMLAITALLVCTFALILGVSVGAYLHVVHGAGLGAPLLWISAVLLVCDLAGYDFAGWGLVPSGTLGGLVSTAYWTGTTIPLVLPILEVLATSCAALAVLASLAPPGFQLERGDVRRATGNYPLPPISS